MDADGGCGGRAGKMKAVKMGGLLTSLSRARERWSSPHNRSAPRRELGHLSLTKELGHLSRRIFVNESYIILQRSGRPHIDRRKGVPRKPDSRCLRSSLQTSRRKLR